MCRMPLRQFPDTLKNGFKNHFTSYGCSSGKHVSRAPYAIIPEVESHIYFFFYMEVIFYE